MVQFSSFLCVRMWIGELLMDVKWAISQHGLIRISLTLTNALKKLSLLQHTDRQTDIETSTHKYNLWSKMTMATAPPPTVVRDNLTISFIYYLWIITVMLYKKRMHEYFIKIFCEWIYYPKVIHHAKYHKDW